MKTIIAIIAVAFTFACNNVSMEPIGMTKGVITSVENLNRIAADAPRVLVDTTGNGVADVICENTFTKVYNGGLYDPRGMEVDVRIFADSCRTNYKFEAYLRKSKPSVKSDVVTAVAKTDSL
jgi:hypothetical protein